MIRIVKPEKIYEHEYGDTDIYGKHYKYLAPIDWADFDVLNPMPISDGYGSNVWKLLIHFGISMKDVKNLKKWSKNRCPCSEMTYNAIVPLVILTDDATKYLDIMFPDRKPIFYDMFIDANHNRNMNWCVDEYVNKRKPEYHMNNVRRAMLGSGYNEGILPSDGSNSFDFAAIPLDNGDKIVVITWVWHNK